jgi:hypothetical protein
MPSENPYLKPRTKGHEAHSSKPTVHYGMPGERQRYWLTGPAGLTRRQVKLYHQQARIHGPLTQHRKKKEKTDGGRRTRRHTRRR